MAGDGENFYPERADFTYQRYIGDEFADHLTTSYPLLVRRKLGNSLGQMLRPYDKEWFHQTVEGDDDSLSLEAKRWLQEKTGIQRRAMYHKDTSFSRAMKEADHDFASFGQAVIQIRLTRLFNQLIYRTWHLRDCCWQEDENGKIGFFARKWKPLAHDLVRLFGEKAGEKVIKLAEKKPFEVMNVSHMIVPAEMWDGDSNGQPWVSIYYDVMHERRIEAVPQRFHEYVVPRWQTVSGSQYAYSPATICGLPDARLVQAMAYTLLEAGEKIANPPMVATRDVVRGDVAVYAGAINWVDRDYDERLGEALRPMTREARGMPLSRDMIHDQREQLAEAFFINELALPQRGPEMTAYEVGQRVQEYIRGALPLFEPMEPEYNGGVCDLTFELMFSAGAFGSPVDVPDDIRERGEIAWRYESPLHDAIEAQLGQTFSEAQALVEAAMTVDTTAGAIMDSSVALRETLAGIGVPMTWMRDPVDEKSVRDSLEARRTMAEMAPALNQASQAAATMTEAA